MIPELLILNHHLSNRVFDFSSERFGVLLFPLSRCCGASTAVAAKKCEPTQGQRPSGHRRRSNRKRQQKWRVFLCVARAVVLSRACNEVGHGAARARFLAAFARSKAVPPEAGAFMTCATRMSSSRQKNIFCKSRNPKLPLPITWGFCFYSIQRGPAPCIRSRSGCRDIPVPCRSGGPPARRSGRLPRPALLRCFYAGPLSLSPPAPALPEK